MKLYTEEQVRKAYNDGNLDGFSNVSALDMCIDSLTPIELPSDEEIKAKVEPMGTLGDIGFIEGAKWGIEQIKQQYNGK
jgi:hypothetical protein